MSPGYLLLDDTMDDTAGLLAPLESGKVACLTCGKTISSMQNAKRHFKLTHQLNQAVKCRLCKAVFKNHTSRDTHQRKIHGLTPSMLRNAVRVPNDPNVQ